MNVANRRWTDDELFAMREEVLQTWPTGSEVDLQDAVAYHKAMADTKRFSKVLASAISSGQTLVQPRAGVPLVENHIELLRYLEQAGADCLPTTIDSYTRQNKYAEAQKGIEESKATGRSMLNGFPAVNHGVGACRKIIESVSVPVQLRHGTPDARLLSEIALAGGYTDIEGGGISYNIPYAKDVSLETTIRDWQYVDRLVGWYNEQGVEINREPFGPLTGTMVPPSVSHAIAIVEALLAAEQGVKFLTLGYGQCGNFAQDIAAILSLKELAREYLEKDGYDVMISTVFHQWMGGFPQDEAKSFGVIGLGAAVAALSGATKIITKTPHEAHGIPTKEANAQGIMASKQIINMLKGQPVPFTPEVQAEKEIIAAETRCILDTVRTMGEGDWAAGTVRAFAAGVLDVPFAPSRYNAGRLLPARDSQGAVRLLDVGNLPFTQEIRDFHRSKLEERGRMEGRNPGFQMVIDDIYAIGKGMLVGKSQGAKK
ncbi:MAG TPA: methylaspartate mutase subunit E [Bacillota bacterium]|nr:methylaspartate mutase subunit E [Bacillota bacterium]HPZ21833.1 methylaspartate mutase subunit E [Bacillota bacterium]HQD19427.1 methylaspartate mutase subunit E [Bacillota bacterium]